MCFEGKQYKCGSGGGHGGGKPMEMRWWWWKEIHINVVVVAVMEGKQLQKCGGSCGGGGKITEK